MNVNIDALSQNLVKSIKKDKNKTNISESENKDDSKNSLNIIKEYNTEENFNKKSISIVCSTRASTRFFENY